MTSHKEPNKARNQRVLNSYVKLFYKNFLLKLFTLLKLLAFTTVNE